MNSKSLKKSVVAFALLLVMGSVGFNSAYGYGGNGSGTRTKVTICHNGNTITVAGSAVAAHLKHGDTRGACVATPNPVPLVLGISTTGGQTGQQYLPLLNSVNTILMSVQSGNQNGDISDEEATKLASQLGSVIAAFKALFR